MAKAKINGLVQQYIRDWDGTLIPMIDQKARELGMVKADLTALLLRHLFFGNCGATVEQIVAQTIAEEKTEAEKNGSK